MAKHLDLGSKGEQLAVEYLLRQGFEILAKNWRFGHKEVDIIAKEGVFLVIIEVKTRSSAVHGFPDEAVNDAKMDLLAEAGSAFLEQNNMDLEMRFDILSIILKEDMPSIYHIRDAFHP
jgi:putative endonuclease